MNNYRLRIIITFFSIFLLQAINAQERYWVFFTDKDNVGFDPYSYFDARTIQKRVSSGIPLVDFSDMPLRKDYIEGIENLTDNIYTISRWFNAVSVSAKKSELEKIAVLPFVQKITPIKTKSKITKRPFKNHISRSNENLRRKQLESLGGAFFTENEIDGTGVRVAIFDAGFSGVDKSPLFEHIRKEDRIVATWDFVRDREFVYSYNSHGTSVFTCIAGQLDDKKFGLATGAEFLLARTEVRREVFSEEENWLAAVEWADRNGADIINSSLGYTHHRYKQRQMDGQSTLVSRAATMAARKGMLVVNAAGNDGSGFWRVIGAPADADSILSVGGINPNTGYKISFSSFGPTSDGRMKPNVAAFGRVTTSNAKEINSASGTSFAAPLVSGFAACVLQMNPAWTNMKLYEEIEKSGHLYPYYDYVHGFGVPQAIHFTGEKKEVPPTFTFTMENDSVRILFINQLNHEEDNSATNVEEEIDLLLKEEVAKEKNEMKLSKNERYNLDDNYMYFHISGKDENEVLKRYAMVRVNESDSSFLIPREEVAGAVLRVFYKGYFSEYCDYPEENHNTFKQ